MIFCLSATIMTTLNSCVTCKNQIKGDVIGFSDNVYPATFEEKRCIIPHLRVKGEPVDLRTNDAKMKSEILKLRSGTNTAAYKALDLGLDRVKHVKKKYMGKCPNTKYYILFFTDGKDNVSATNEKSYEKYNKKIERKMKKTMGAFNKKNSFQSYAMLLIGPELQQDGYTNEQLDIMLKPFTGSQNNVRPNVLKDKDLDNLFAQFIDEFTTQSFSFYVPKGYEGKRIKMILQNNSNVEVSFEGDFVKKGFKYCLQNITTSNGFKFEMDHNDFIAMDVSTDKKSNKINFQIKGLKKDGKGFSPSRAGQQFMDMGAYRVNSEYKQTADQTADVYILAIIDCSKSMGEEMGKAKQKMIDAINKIVSPAK